MPEVGRKEPAYPVKHGINWRIQALHGLDNCNCDNGAPSEKVATFYSHHAVYRWSWGLAFRVLVHTSLCIGSERGRCKGIAIIGEFQEHVGVARLI